MSTSKEKNSFFNDEFDLTSILSVLFDNFNILFSVLISSFFVVSIFYLTSENIYQSNSLIEIKREESSLLPNSFLDANNLSQNSLDAEIEIYKSDDTIIDALANLRRDIDFETTFPSAGYVRSNLVLKTDSVSLINISYKSNDYDLNSILLDELNNEFIKDRTNFKKQSSAAGKNFVRNEIPRIKKLLKEAEDNLNSFKISTNTSDVIFDTNTRNFKLDQLKDRVNEIEFKELELKEFYKENHPIYLTLSEQKKLVLSQINEIEADLPNIPSTQRQLENFKREVEIYSNVLRELSSQELTLGMSEAASISNVRIINKASAPSKISPTRVVFIFAIIFTFVVYVLLLFGHFLGDRVTNLDSLIDFKGKDKVIGELPFIKDMDKSPDRISQNVADELLNKSIFEIVHSDEDFKSIAIVSSRKDVGKTEVVKRLFNKLREKELKVCLIDLDYRKKGLTKELFNEADYSNFDQVNADKNKFIADDGSMFIPSLNVDSPADFFTTKEFTDQIDLLKKEFDFVLCDTPPWRLFVDAKIISKHFNKHLYIVCNKVTTFKDIELFSKDFDDETSIRFFYNKFKLYFSFLWFKYQYPYYTRNYYYDYLEYSNLKRNFTFFSFSLKFIVKTKDRLIKWLISVKERFF